MKRDPFAAGDAADIDIEALANTWQRPDPNAPTLDQISAAADQADDDRLPRNYTR